MIKTGIGFDIHRMVADETLVLGGVHIDYHSGLEGYSDADVLCHAIADALLGAVAAGDIGNHFPDTDPKWKGVESLKLLGEVLKLLEKRGASIINVDSTIIAQAPTLRPYIERMRNNLSTVLSISIEAISVKATSTEKMGMVGREEGMAAMAIATVEI